MLVKFLARGTGSAQAAADYLLRETDSQGQVREDVAVLRGDPDGVAAVADSLEFDHKYTSGVIAWAPEDRPSDWDIDRVLDEVEQTAWAGLAPDRYAWAAVQHRTANGGVHVHVLAARCDLETGKSLNIAPPGWEQTYDPLVEACNLDKGWSRPDDPSRAREQQPGHRAYLDAAALRAGIAREDDPRAAIQDYLLQGVESGKVKDRAGVVAALQEAGLDVPRQGKNYVTAHNPASGKRWRLKGTLYEHDFQRSRFTRPIRRRMETEDREMDAIVARELQTFGERLRASVSHKLHTIETVMETETTRIHGQLRGLRELLWRDFRADLVIVVSILLIIFGGSWGLTQWLSSRVQRLLETQETLQLELAQTQTALDQLQAETWGVWLHEEDGMRYVVLPRGTLNEEWPLTVDGQPAIRLSSE